MLCFLCAALDYVFIVVVMYYVSLRFSLHNVSSVLVLLLFLLYCVPLVCFCALVCCIACLGDLQSGLSFIHITKQTIVSLLNMLYL